MPIYEFYCENCNAVFNFYSKSINTSKRPACPKCNEVKLQRLLSRFSIRKQGSEESGEDSFPIDESKIEKAVGMLAQEAQNINEDDPRQAANLMRRLSEMTGLHLGKGMQEAMERMEAGEDPEKIEEEMSDILEEDPVVLPEKKTASKKFERLYRDDTLYEL
ncbi:MAG TPA: zinc ribbon domain-containing protein [Desulfatiglandales bacterium]|nr:zinc ribbon domain-containing protein [Desulfatiglandales bacterium]